MPLLRESGIAMAQIIRIQKSAHGAWWRPISDGLVVTWRLVGRLRGWLRCYACSREAAAPGATWVRKGFLEAPPLRPKTGDDCWSLGTFGKSRRILHDSSATGDAIWIYLKGNPRKKQKVFKGMLFGWFWLVRCLFYLNLNGLQQAPPFWPIFFTSFANEAPFRACAFSAARARISNKTSRVRGGMPGISKGTPARATLGGAFQIFLLLLINLDVFGKVLDVLRGVISKNVSKYLYLKISSIAGAAFQKQCF